MDSFFNFITIIIYLIIIVVVLTFIFSTKLNNYHSHWNTLIDNFKSSPHDFYNLLKEEINSNGINRINITNVSLKEGNIFSSKRMYLRIEWKEFQYDVCASPIGKGFFISWWLLYKNSLGQILLAKIPFVGTWLVNKLFPTTYYSVDTASMFMTYCQTSVLSVIDSITNEKGLRVLSENERKPVLMDIFKR